MTGSSVVLVVVGDEVLSGRTVDSNGAWFARRLFEQGARLAEIRVVADRRTEIADAVRGSAARAAVVLLSGGLGPTADDVTRDGLADLVGALLVPDRAAAEMLRSALSRRGRAVSPAQEVQALLPPGARPLENGVGTAPGIDLSYGGARVIALPGVPAEFRQMAEAHVFPLLRAAGGLVPTVSRSVWVAGIPEADAGAKIRELMDAPEPRIGSYPAEGEIEIRVVARGDLAIERAEETAKEVRLRLGVDVVGDQPLAPTVVGLLKERGLRVTVAESLTGGLLCAYLTEVPGASEVFPGGFVTYSDREKRSVLEVPADLLLRHGAVSSEVASAMAEGALRRTAADLAVALTGVAGPDPAPGPAGPVPVGTVYVALARTGASTRVLPLSLGGLPRHLVRRRAALAALDLIRRAVRPAAG